MGSGTKLGKDFFNFIIIIALIFLAAAYIFNVIIPFAGEYSYLKMEMKRSSGSQRKRYKKKMILLFLKLIPFARFFMKK